MKPELPAEGLLYDEPMARHTSLKAGGPARILAQPASEAQLQEFLALARQRHLPVLIVGAGTNLLVRDGGFAGMVLKTTRLCSDTQVADLQGTPLSDLPAFEAGQRVYLQAAAGCPLAALCRFALRHGLAGLNFGWGIPGTLGGAVAMNAGASGAMMAQVVTGVRGIRMDGTIAELPREALNFGYRHLSLTDTWPNQTELPVIARVRLGLVGESRARLRQEARQIWQQRRLRQPLRAATAGCFFKNPRPDLPAGRLIEAAGLKGFRVGDAQVSPVHANFIVNTGLARACDLLELAEIVRTKVQARYGVLLENEVMVAGEA